jgi:hypothetical protein
MRNRSVIEIMVMIFTFCVSFCLFGFTAAIAIIKIKDPDADIDSAVDVIFTAINIIIGALLGMLTVKGSANTELTKRPEEKELEIE